MNIQGKWFDGHSARPVNATLALLNGEARLESSQQQQTYPFAGISVSDRLGSTPRILSLPDGSQFETTENAAIDQWLAAHQAHTPMSLVHRLEQHWRAVAACFVLLVGIIVGFWQWGIPAVAKTVAMHIPEKTVSAFGRDSLWVLERSGMLTPSTLPQERQDELRNRFARLQNAAGRSPAVPVHFRHFKAGPNAFALIDSQIVFTDEIIELAGDDRELDSVLLHELGHIEKRHALRNILQSSSIAILWSTITGDASGIAATILSGPAILAQLGYSRDFEREADDFAYENMQKMDIPLVHFSNMMARMEYCLGGKTPEKGDRLTDYMSTHPSSEERINHFGKDTVSDAQCPKHYQ